MDKGIPIPAVISFSYNSDNPSGTKFNNEYDDKIHIIQEKVRMYFVSVIFIKGIEIISKKALHEAELKVPVEYQPKQVDDNY